MDACDRWKLASPDDYFSKVIAGHCPQCKSKIYVGQEAVYEGLSGEYFCDYGCYRKFVREHLDDYLEFLESALHVRSRIVEEE